MKEAMPVVSVIIPLYDVEDYIGECLESALAQTLSDIEIICVDDGSPDRSASIVEKYMNKDSRISLIRKENGGLSSARNAALAVARGEFVYFLDSDDILEKETLQTLVDKARSESLDVVYFNAVAFFESEKVRRDNVNYIDFYKRRGDYSGVKTGQSMFASMRENREFMPSVCLQLFRRSLIVDNGLRFYDGIIHEDNLFSFQTVILAKRVAYIDRPFYKRRVRGNSTMTVKKSMKNVDGYLVSYAEMLAFMRGREVEKGAFDTLNDFLYNSVFGNARHIYSSLDIKSEEAALEHGDFIARHFLYIVKQTTETDSDRSYIKQENKRLREQNVRIENEYRTSMAFRVGSVITFLPRMAVLALRGIRKRGLGYTLRVACMKLRQRLGGNAPLVSIILPVYNAAPYLEQCIRSLMCQTMRRIEIIAVDDGSTDDSLAILRQLAEEDGRVKILTQQNKYAGAARNLGLSQAKGEYVIFLDSDDFFAKGLVADSYNAGKLAKADAVLFGAKHYNTETGEYKEAKWLLGERFAPKKQPFCYKDCPDVFYRISTPAPWTKLFRREFVQKSGLQFQAIQNANDIYFTYSALAMAERIVTVDKSLVYYRVGMTANTQSTKQKHPLCFAEAYLAWHDKLVELGVLDTVRRSYVSTALSGCIYNLRSQKNPESKRTVFDKLKGGFFGELELCGYDEDYYYNKDHYDEMQRVLSMDFESYMSLTGEN